MTDEVPGGSTAAREDLGRFVDEALVKDRAQREKDRAMRERLAAGIPGGEASPPIAEHKRTEANGKRNGSTLANKPGFSGRSPNDWLNLDLTKPLEARFEEWLASGNVPDSWPDLLGRLLGSGLGVSFREKSEREFCVTLSDGARFEAGKPNKLSGWDSTPLGALQVAYFKHFELLGGDWDSELKAELPVSVRR